MSGGSCKIIPRATIEKCGLEQADQIFIDDTIEAGVVACRFQRPSPRDCAALREQVAADRRALEAFRTGAAAPAPAPKKKPTLWQRIKGRVSKMDRG